MRHLLKLSDWSIADLRSLFAAVDRCRSGDGERFDGAAVFFFPPSSLRTRVSFECGASLMGLQPITFPPETLSKDEDVVDVVGYLASWARIVVARYPDIAVLDRMANANVLPIINAMTDVNHPCEVLSDLYALSQDADPVGLRYVFVGADGNIGRGWWEGAQAFGLDIVQCCPHDLRIPDMPWNDDLSDAVAAADVLITDGPGKHAAALAPYQITAELLRSAPDGVRLAPCPPFVRGREVSADAIEHPAFVGYRFKETLMPIQQAVMWWALHG